MSWIKSRLPTFFMIAFTAVLLEIGSWVIWNNFISDRDSGAAAVRQILTGETNTFNTILSHPYSLFWNNPDYVDAEFGKQYNSLGYRSDELSEEGEDPYIVLVLGGSTTNAYPYVRDRTKIWTELLEGKIEAQTGRNVAVLNAGIPYGTTAELMVHFLMNGRYLEPDLVIYHGGGNDSMPLMFPGYRTDYSHVRAAQNGREPSAAVQALLRYSHTARLIVSRVVSGSVYSAQPYGFAELDPAATLERVQSTDPAGFRGNLSVIARETVDAGADLLLVAFLQARKERLSNNRGDIAGLEDAILLASEKNDQVMKEVATRYGQRFLKLDQDAFKDEWFLDNTHLNEEGEAEKAHQIFQALLPILQDTPDAN